MQEEKTIVVETWINASAERCFDAARDLDLHVRSIPNSNERAIAGRLTGLIELDEEVTWRGRHFGIVQTFTSRITAFDRPHHFRDEMQRGAFKSFKHDHDFESDGARTKMIDTLAFSAPFGILGRIAEALVLRRYLEKLLVTRAAVIKAAAESA
jgi:ligand-binding SRPBCC domain-containing protein